jgi:hypothetical protein
MNENLSARDLIDDPIRFEMNFPEGVYADTLKLRWAVAPKG